MIKLFNLQSLVLFFILASTSFSSAQFQYISPEPGSKFHDPNTSIILRNGNLLDENSLLTKNIFTITGSVSGKHNCKITLAEKDKTIILKPTTPFTGGEIVTVNVAEGIRNLSKEKILGTSFSFEIRNTRTAEENELIAHQMEELLREEFGDQSTGIRGGSNSGVPDIPIHTN